MGSTVHGSKEEEDEATCDNIKSLNAQQQATNLGSKLGMEFNKVGGLDAQLDTIIRRVLASRSSPQTAKRLGISHVRGILLSGPPGCGKTLLARELARLLGAREPQIVNGPEILDKFIGEAEKRVRDLFKSAEIEYAAVGDNSALHIIILDEMDAIARKRGSTSSDTTGVRDSVVNQLLAKIDGVKEANNILVIGLTNRPELLDPALLRPGRLEVQLRVELPDLSGRRDIFRIHTRQMKEAGGLHISAQQFIDDLSDNGLPAKSDKFTGAEIAGLVRSAASFALARSVTTDGLDVPHDDEVERYGSDISDIKVTRKDFEQALYEVVPVLGKQDALLLMRFPNGIVAHSSSMERIMRDLMRFVAPSVGSTNLHSLLLVGEGSRGGTGVTALGAWACAEASKRNSLDYVRFITALDLLTSGDSSGSDSARASALIDCFSEAREMPN
jgi:vesicle-fusing ATPase